MKHVYFTRGMNFRYTHLKCRTICSGTLCLHAGPGYGACELVTGGRDGQLLTRDLFEWVCFYVYCFFCTCVRTYLCVCDYGCPCVSAYSATSEVILMSQRTPIHCGTCANYYIWFTGCVRVWDPRVKEAVLALEPQVLLINWLTG